MSDIMRNEDGDPIFPCYSISAAWIYDKADSKDADLPPGRAWNLVLWHNFMRREEMTKREQNLLAAERWAAYEKKGENPQIARLEVTPLGMESWVLTWFQHETIDVGQTDAEALASFERYVERKCAEAYREGREPSLMGAEDRWRWHGAGEDGDAEARTDAPCRCKHCRKHGVIRIGH